MHVMGFPMLMRQSVADWPFLRGGQLDPARYYATLADIGYAAVEMARSEHWPLARAAGRELLNIAAPARDWGLNDVAEHARLLPVLCGAISVAAEAGIPNVIVFSGNRRGSSDAAGIESCVRGLDAVAGDAADASVTLLFELLNAIDHPDYHAASSQFVFEVVRRVASPAVRVLYDVYHATRTGEAVEQDLVRHHDLIGHIHVAGFPGRGFPGEGQEIDYERLIRTARLAGYRGYCGQEFVPGADALAELREAYGLFDSYAGDAH
jgi:hydroxypyruvate isomerase